MDETRHTERTGVEEALAMVVDSGLEGMPRAIEILMNEAMKRERSAFLGADPHERDPERRGHANGYKPRSVDSRVGVLALRIRQVRASTTASRGSTRSRSSEGCAASGR